jgi:hypothetical protein
MYKYTSELRADELDISYLQYSEPHLKCIAGEKDSGPGLFRTLEDFKFRATYALVQHLHFFEKKSEKSKRNPKHITNKSEIRHQLISHLKRRETKDAQGSAHFFL